MAVAAPVAAYLPQTRQALARGLGRAKLGLEEHGGRTFEGVLGAVEV